MKKKFKTSYFLRIFYCVIGWIMIVLGFIGIILPIVPTIPFLLIASWCFSRSSPQFHDWLNNHRILGAFITQWKEKRAIPIFIKVFVVVSMTSGLLMFWVTIHPSLWLTLSVVAIFLLIVTYVITRPSS
ncbi:YbaN family protein [Bartonella sp. B30(2025)]